MNSPLDILIVDDHEDSALALAKMLSFRRENYVITISNSFKEAVVAADNRHFDLLLCDIGLPEGDGCDLLHQLRAKYPIKAIATTAYAMARDIQRYRDAGFDDHVIKPFTIDEILGAIDRVMATTNHRG